jgi:alginate O-acetyltransferase complex protein AlgI
MSLIKFETPHYAKKKQMIWGINLIILGLFQKVVIADTLLAPAVEAVYGSNDAMSFRDSTFGFSSHRFGGVST